MTKGYFHRVVAACLAFTAITGVVTFLMSKGAEHEEHEERDKSTALTAARLDTAVQRLEAQDEGKSDTDRALIRVIGQKKFESELR